MDIARLRGDIGFVQGVCRLIGDPEHRHRICIKSRGLGDFLEQCSISVSGDKTIQVGERLEARRLVARSWVFAATCCSSAV